MITFFFVPFGLLIVLIVFVIRYALVVVTITGHSMEPAIAPGDRVIVMRYWPAAWLRKGQIVLMLSSAREHLPGPVWSASSCIKRVVGLPGDIIVIDSTELPDHDPTRSPWPSDREGQYCWHIPPGHFFVRGDNRAESIDSLLWGPVPYNRLLGLVIKTLPGATGAQHGIAQEPPMHPEPERLS